MRLTNLLLLSSGVLGAPAVHHSDRHNDKREVVIVTKYVDQKGGEVSQPAVQTTLSSVTSSSAAPTSVATGTTGSGGSGGVHGDLGDFSGPNQEFQDGVIPCSQFPSGQGVVKLDWVGLDGWASIMDLNGNTASTCKEGFYCSYACQAGMSKTQWPSEQPADGRTVGGLQCKNGFLYRANPNSKYLCEWDQNSASAVNKKSQSICMCRTDYPGSENMVVPTVIDAMGSKPVSVVKEDSYYQWQGKKTSTQYYVNNAGVSVEEGCIWGEPGSGVGNWAPVVLGAGYTNGITYLSIIPNPNNRNPPNYNIKIVANEGSSINGECKLENGVYTGSGSDGCTVSVTSGSASFVFY
ncbi:hypothetical protein HG537_0A07950 [Torulaspora globosa]|uniref:SUN-domain-containing protein n=1 Tax=Torulaspora globosa TaxID=48254 RepID=A0A7H9HL48_9SACH|nr:hypothetical protein HG537_0A07950 [Torulaspora sp. CBS 2947]